MLQNNHRHFLRHPSKFFFRISHQEELFTLNAISLYARKHHHLLQTIRAQKQIKVEHFQFHGNNTMHGNLSIDLSNQFLFAAKKFCQPTWKRARLMKTENKRASPQENVRKILTHCMTTFQKLLSKTSLIFHRPSWFLVAYPTINLVSKHPHTSRALPTLTGTMTKSLSADVQGFQ